MSDWGWHSYPNKLNLTEAETLKSFDFGHGHEEVYAVEYKAGRADERNVAATNYFRTNPHRLNLGLVGLEFTDGKNLMSLDSISNIHQYLDLSQGTIFSQYNVLNHSVNVTTFAAQDKDAIEAEVTSLLLSEGKARVSLKFAYPSGKHSDDGQDWTKPELHKTELVKQGQSFAVLKRTIDASTYYVKVDWDGYAHIEKEANHHFAIIPEQAQLCFRVAYSADMPKDEDYVYKADMRTNKKKWSKYWDEGAAVDFSQCTDPRAKEIERRVVLSQYLTAIQTCGSMPPQESGLTYNTWFGRPHLEMAWWHMMPYALYGHTKEFKRMLDWYNTAADKSFEIAKRQNFKGLRWMKMTDPWFGESPSNVGSFLIWQQPHYIYMAEEVFRADSIASHGTSKEALQKYAANVEATAEFMADFAHFDSSRNEYVLKGCTAMQESMSKDMSLNQPFELAYWRYGLEVAQKWRTRLGKARNKHWDEVINGLPKSLPTFKDLGLNDDAQIYSAGEANVKVDSTWLLKQRSDHPAVLGACGLLPKQPFWNAEQMNKTYDWVMKHWNWLTTWGWDYGMMAMTAARLGRAEDAINNLLVGTQKNTYLVNGHNYQDDRLRIYLPGNASLLIAVSMMSAGWDGTTTVNPGWPKDGKWNVRWEGLQKMQ